MGRQNNIAKLVSLSLSMVDMSFKGPHLIIQPSRLYISTLTRPIEAKLSWICVGQQGARAAMAVPERLKE